MSTQKCINSVNAAELAVLESGNRLVGAKQIHKAVSAGSAQQVFLAENADPAITEPLVVLCQQYGIPCAWVPSMAELGKYCGIEVGAAAAAAVR